MPSDPSFFKLYQSNFEDRQIFNSPSFYFSLTLYLPFNCILPCHIGAVLFIFAPNSLAITVTY